MFQFGNTSISYDRIHIIDNNTYSKWDKWKKILLISIISTIIFLILCAVTFISLKIYFNNKQKLSNSTFITNLTSNTGLLSTITGTS